MQPQVKQMGPPAPATPVLSADQQCFIGGKDAGCNPQERGAAFKRLVDSGDELAKYVFAVIDAGQQGDITKADGNFSTQDFDAIIKGANLLALTNGNPYLAALAQSFATDLRPHEDTWES
jgi:hypothetical protein